MCPFDTLTHYTKIIERNKNLAEELVDIYDENGVSTGESLPREIAIQSGKLIKAFQIWILNNQNQVLIQRRSSNKVHDAGMLDLCSGHVQSGELEITAVAREIVEELGPNAIKRQEFNNIRRVGMERADFRKYGRVGNYIIPWYYLKLNRQIPDDAFSLQREEVEAIEWIPYEKVKEIIRLGKQNIRVPYIKQTENLLKKLDEIVYKDRDRDAR